MYVPVPPSVANANPLDDQLPDRVNEVDVVPEVAFTTVFDPLAEIASFAPRKPDWKPR
jgi:hypothetical protein